MNERIKEIALQAKITFTNYGSGDFLDEDDICRRRLEKFAELIVKECVAICQDTDGEDNIDARSGRQDCAVEIQEHFGVK